MRVTRIDFIVVALCAIFSALSAQITAATSYVPHTVIEEQQTDRSSVGIICLFHGADPAVVRPLLGREFALSRTPAAESPADQSPVGRGRLTAIIGAHYLEAMMIDGAAKPGDVAQLAESFALVVLTNGRCETLKPAEQEPGE